MKQKHNLFSKTIALAMAILIASTTLTGCSWFSSRQDESSQEVVLEAPEPDAQDPGEDIVDDSEVTADEDPTIQSDEEENVVEEPDTTPVVHLPTHVQILIPRKRGLVIPVIWEIGRAHV